MYTVEGGEKEEAKMNGLIGSMKVMFLGLARRMDRANTERQRWMTGLTMDTRRRERS